MMRGAVFFSFALLFAFAGAEYQQYLHPGQANRGRDFTIVPSTCPPCDCTTTTPRPTTTTRATTTRPAVTTTPPCTKPPTHPPKFCPDCVNNRCTPNACDLSVLVPFPGDCTKFCQCEYGGAKEFDCPGGLHFNEILQICDWPNQAQCTVSGTYLGGCEGIRP
ncbi:peritrophin-1-like [Neocloeon triangulifer]|uniref:peritrophin-1-like n=1 Tax=Neocloeon triangulifer TaxID=2078957 RepID=UPI00286EC833|nr:peritrophin-1-like [Neocloeon triangulifer]